MAPSQRTLDAFLWACIVLSIGNLVAPLAGLERIDALSYLAPGLAGILYGGTHITGRRRRPPRTDEKDDESGQG